MLQAGECVLKHMRACRSELGRPGEAAAGGGARRTPREAPPTARGAARERMRAHRALAAAAAAILFPRHNGGELTAECGSEADKGR